MPKRPRGISDLSVEVIIEILGYCSPADLLVLASVARNFSNILASDSIWTKSRELIGIPAPPNILQSEINLWTPAWTEKKFAAFIFGLARCSSCCNASKGLPKHYLLPFQVRLCSDVCLDRFLREKAAEVDVRGYAGALVTHRSSYRNWLPATRIQGTERRLHLISQIRAAEAEFVECRDDPARLVMLNSELDERRKATVKIGQANTRLWRWRNKYDAKTKLCARKTMDLIQQWVSRDALSLSHQLRQPFMARVFSAFVRDNLVMSFPAWAYASKDANHHAMNRKSVVASKKPSAAGAAKSFAKIDMTGASDASGLQPPSTALSGFGPTTSTALYYPKGVFFTAIIQAASHQMAPHESLERRWSDKSTHGLQEEVICSGKACLEDGPGSH
ncbi:hypothetical protein C8J56DRAFT_1060730 [Mycena floridula]|nr:hypothetical protein C8J56DRAFT_1060730 [Mycena floridula]